MLTVYGTLFHQRTYTSVGRLGKTSHAIILSVQATYRCSSSVWWPNVCLMSKCCLKPTSVVRVWWARSGLCSELWRSVFIILLSHAYTSQDQPLRPEALSRKTPFGLLVSTLCLPSGKCWMHPRIYALSLFSFVPNQRRTGCTSFFVPGDTSWRCHSHPTIAL